LDLRIIETTDIHAHVMAFDYYRDRPTERLGLARTASLIKTIRLVDAQGERHDVEIGYIGFVPPQIMTWDRRHLVGRAVAQDIVESARH